MDRLVSSGKLLGWIPNPAEKLFPTFQSYTVICLLCFSFVFVALTWIIFVSVWVFPLLPWIGLLVAKNGIFHIIACQQQPRAPVRLQRGIVIWAFSFLQCVSSRESPCLWPMLMCPSTRQLIFHSSSVLLMCLPDKLFTWSIEIKGNWDT